MLFLLLPLIVVYLGIIYFGNLAEEKIKIQNLSVPTFLLSQPVLSDHNIVTTVLGQEKVLVDHLKIGDGTTLITQMAISPDKKRLCFETQSGKNYNLYWSFWDGSNPIFIGSGTDCRWSPDSSKIAYLKTKQVGNDVACYWIDTKLNLILTNRQKDYYRDYRKPIWSLNNLEIFVQYDLFSSNQVPLDSGIAVIDVSNRTIIDK